MGIKQWLIALSLGLSFFIGGTLFLETQKPVVISANFGGSIGSYIEDYANIRHSKKEVRIEDVCISACTLVLGLVPNSRVCAEPQAVFGFHSAWFMGPFGPVFSREGTRIVWNLYPETVRTELKKRGWDGEGNDPHPDLVYVPATKFVKECVNG